METLEIQETTKSTKSSKMIAFLAKHKRAFLIGSLVVVVIVLACILLGIIHNAILTNRVQSYLDGKMFIRRNGIWTTAYTFNKNTVGKESWCSSDHSSSGDINEMLRYRATGSLGSEEVQLWYKDDVQWWYGPDIIFLEDGSVEFCDGEWNLATTNEIDTLRKETLCEHEFDQDVIIKAATCASGGEISHTCIKCGYLETQSTASLEHNYKNKICTECGAKKQPQKAYNVEPNTWYTYQDVLHFQNIKLQNAFSVSQGKGMMVSYYFVCQHCHVVDETLRQNVPEFNYDINKMFSCEECGGLTTVKIELG